MKIQIGHLAAILFFINMDIIQDQLDTKGILCVKFQNSDISSFRGDTGTAFELTEMVENSKWPLFFSF